MAAKTYKLIISLTGTPSNERQIFRAGKVDFVSGIDFNPLTQEVIVPGKKLKHNLQTHIVYWDTIATDYIQGAEIVRVSDDIKDYIDENAVWTDPVSGLKGPPDLMQTLVNRRELFGDTENPVSPSGYPGNVNARLNNLETIHGKLGFHNQQVFASLYKRPKDLLIYYGYPNSFNSATNGWDNEKIAQDMCKYDVIVLGNKLANVFTGSHDGADNASILTDSSENWIIDEFNGNFKVTNTTDNSSGTITDNDATTVTATLAGGTDNDWDIGDNYEIQHLDYDNLVSIISRIKSLKPSILIFGYVSTTHTLTRFQFEVDAWDTVGVHGIFMDESGYDYGSVATNGRTAFNTKVDYVHGKTTANLAFVNAWNMDHIIGTANDTSYPNTTWNPSEVDSTLSANDWYLLESYPINTTAYTTSDPDGYEPKADWASRGVKAIGHRANYGINLAAAGIINNANAIAQDLFDFQFVSACMWSLEANGTSDTSYAASSAAVTFWTRENISSLVSFWTLNPSIQVDNGDSDVYWRFLQSGQFKLDFSNTAQLSDVIFL